MRCPREFAGPTAQPPVAAIVDTQHQFDQVAVVYGAIAVGVFVIVSALVLITAFRYRARNDAREPSRIHDAPRAEFLYVLMLMCVAAFLVAFTFVHENSSDAALTAHPGLVVRVSAAKWHWSFSYPRFGISELGSDNRSPTLFVPRDTNIDFQLTSVDVIHAFWIPLTRFKRAAYPDVTQYFTLSFTKTGFFRNAGECAEFCGLLHAEMRFNVDVMSPSAFQRWTAGRARSA
jgi:cytochrome c oxidase subunit II